MARTCLSCNEKISLFQKSYQYEMEKPFCSKCYAEKLAEGEKKAEEMRANKEREQEEIRMSKVEALRALKEKYTLILQGSYNASSFLYNMAMPGPYFRSHLFELDDENYYIGMINFIFEYISDKPDLNLDTIKELEYDMDFYKSVLLKAPYYKDNQDAYDFAIMHIEMFQYSYELNNYYQDHCLRCLRDKNSMRNEIWNLYTRLEDDLTKTDIIRELNHRNALEVYFSFKAVFSYLKYIEVAGYLYHFVGNDELSTIHRNLLDAGLNAQEISERLYPIYWNLHRNAFSCTLNIDEFNLLLTLLEWYENSNTPDRIDQIMSWGKDDNSLSYIRQIKPWDERVDYNTYIRTQIFDIVTEKNIHIVVNDLKLEAYECISSMTNRITKEILRMNLNSIDFMDVFRTIELAEIIKRELWDKYDLFRAIIERDRILSGDTRKEQLEIADKFDFSNLETGYDFEEYLVRLFRRMEYNAELTPKSNDQGADMIIERAGKRTVVQAKYYSQPVGNKAVQEVVAAKAFYNADNSMVVTNNTFTDAAYSLASSNNVKLIDGDQLNDMRKQAYKKRLIDN